MQKASSTITVARNKLSWVGTMENRPNTNGRPAHRTAPTWQVKSLEVIALAAFFFVLSAAPSPAATIYAQSAARVDVATAVSGAASGDTVIIPPGPATWSSAITVNKAITIQGAGTNSSTGTIITGPAFLLKPGLDSLTRVTAIQFYQADWSTGYIITAIGLCMAAVDTSCAVSCTAAWPLAAVGAACMSR